MPNATPQNPPANMVDIKRALQTQAEKTCEDETINFQMAHIYSSSLPPQQDTLTKNKTTGEWMRHESKNYKNTPLEADSYYLTIDPLDPNKPWVLIYTDIEKKQIEIAISNITVLNDLYQTSLQAGQDINTLLKDNQQGMTKAIKAYRQNTQKTQACRLHDYPNGDAMLVSRDAQGKTYTVTVSISATNIPTFTAQSSSEFSDDIAKQKNLDNLIKVIAEYMKTNDYPAPLSVTLTGTADEKNVMEQACQKYGLTVSNTLNATNPTPNPTSTPTLNNQPNNNNPQPIDNSTNNNPTNPEGVTITATTPSMRT